MMDKHDYPSITLYSNVVKRCANEGDGMLGPRPPKTASTPTEQIKVGGSAPVAPSRWTPGAICCNPVQKIIGYFCCGGRGRGAQRRAPISSLLQARAGRQRQDHSRRRPAAPTRSPGWTRPKRYADTAGPAGPTPRTMPSTLRILAATGRSRRPNLCATFPNGTAVTSANARTTLIIGQLGATQEAIDAHQNRRSLIC